MKRAVIIVLFMVLTTCCQSKETIFQIPESSLYVKVIDGGRGSLFGYKNYKNEAILCIGDCRDFIGVNDTIFARKGVEDLPLSLIINPLSTDTIYYMTIGARTVSNNRYFQKIERFSHVRNGELVHYSQLERKDTLFFNEIENHLYRVREPFVEVLFDQKFDRCFFSMPQQSGYRKAVMLRGVYYEELKPL